MALLRMLRQIISDFGRNEISPNHRPNPLVWSDSDITATWLGHATVLLNLRGLIILTDPVFFSRIGIRLWPFVIGPKRFVKCALSPAELPKIDLILLSHAHMDHLDLASLQALPKDCTVITPKAVSDVFKRIPFRQVIELDWTESIELNTRLGPISLTAQKLRHWGARTRTDTHRRYNAFVLEKDAVRICFAGDTARTDASHLAAKGPLDLIIVPIGAYHPWINSHCTPEEAVDMAREAQARFLLPIHHQTFRLSWEPMEEPIQRFQKVLAPTPEKIALTEIGQTFILP